MDEKKPKNMEEYIRWLRSKHDVEISPRTAVHYESVTNRVKSELERSDFWTNLTRNLREYDDEYRIVTGYPLLARTDLQVLVKPYSSFLLKTFRKNVIDNKYWPDEPGGGWVLPENWFSKINDILRTLIVVKYLDGVQFMSDRVKTLCGEHDQKCRTFFEAREEGYYAAHLYTKQRFEIPSFTWDTERVDVSIEIQVTTQLQEVIRRLLHTYYEDHRRQGTRKEKWQWDFRSEEFSANYLGHILHYVEGMIMEVREKQKEGGP